MNRDQIIAALQAHEAELRASGVAGLSLIGSTARGEQRDNSDIDILVRFDSEFKGLAYFGRIDQLTHRLEAILKRPVDVIAEPVQKERLRREVKRDRTIAF